MNARLNADGICLHCGRTMSWHAGTKCYSREATGMPKPAQVQAKPKNRSSVSDA